MTESMKRRLFAVAAVLVAVSALAAVSMSNLGDNLVYYWSPSELKARSAEDATVRLGGMVVAGTLTWDKHAQVVEFDVTDMKEVVHVRLEGTPPAMFREGIGAVVEGKLGSDGTFHSDKIMVKHDNQYQAPGEGGQMPDMEAMRASLEGGG
jgi:cytochrome c-type biogenesis protein CcmE